MKFGCINEYGNLETVILMRPDPDVVQAYTPEEAMFGSIPDPSILLEEFDKLVELLQSLNITTHVCNDYKFPNQMFARDLAFVGPSFFFLAKPKYEIREGEQLKLAEFLISLGVREDQIVYSKYPFEGADLFWMDYKTVLASIGSRTSSVAVYNMMSHFHGNVELVEYEAVNIKVPQHILGHKHIISHDMLSMLDWIDQRTLGFKNIICTAKTDEILLNFGMNMLTVGPNKVIMTDDCPDFQALLEMNGVTCYTSPMSEIRKMGGGFACMVLPIKRG